MTAVLPFVLGAVLDHNDQAVVAMAAWDELDLIIWADHDGQI